MSFCAMLTVAYLANQFPASVEPYVGDEIQELRRRGVRVIPGSVRRPESATSEQLSTGQKLETLCLQPLRLLTLLRALGLVVRHWHRISSLLVRVAVCGKERPHQRLKALAHTWLGAYYAILLQECGVDHVHVHHGYFGSWVGMVAARLLDRSFSLTLHGSDLLLRGSYLDAKLSGCRFCLTVSEFNRRYILDRFTEIDPRKIIVSRLGVETILPKAFRQDASQVTRRKFTLLAVGRLHAVKDHAFLVRGCARLRDRGPDFECLIAGEGPERRSLELLIQQERLQERITLLGRVAREKMDTLYRKADVVVLTSRSEGVPLVLMEAMARNLIVVAPAITGIPELVIPGKTGFLYRPRDLEDFVQRVLFLHFLLRQKDDPVMSRLNWIRHAARVQISTNYSREKNLNRFGDLFVRLIAPPDWRAAHENSVLQQI
ncbi:MAG: glycosyltransferase family 4 protein [Candidatus Sulfotelmatobacter sp.]